MSFEIKDCLCKSSMLYLNYVIYFLLTIAVFKYSLTSYLNDFPISFNVDLSLLQSSHPTPFSYPHNQALLYQLSYKNHLYAQDVKSELAHVTLHTL